jgi:hypothetical protein
VHISAAWSKDEKKYNGLEAISKLLVDQPLVEHYIIAKVTTKRITRDIDEGGAEIPTVALKHIEVISGAKAEKSAKRLFETACKERLGELPQASLFDDVDPAEGGEDDDPEDVDKGTLSDSAYELSKRRGLAESIANTPPEEEPSKVSSPFSG